MQKSHLFRGILKVCAFVMVFIFVTPISANGASKFLVQLEWRAIENIEIPQSEDFDESSETSSDWLKSQVSDQCAEDYPLAQFKLQGASGKTLASSTIGSTKNTIMVSSASWVEDEYGETNFRIIATCIGRMTLNLASKSNFYRVILKSDSENSWMFSSIESRWFSHSELTYNKWKLSTELEQSEYISGTPNAFNWTPKMNSIVPRIILQSSAVSNGENWTEKGSVNATFFLANPEFAPVNQKYYRHLSVRWKTRASDPEWMYDSNKNVLEINLSPTYGEFVDGKKLIQVIIEREDEDVDAETFDLYVSKSGEILSIAKKA